MGWLKADILTVAWLSRARTPLQLGADALVAHGKWMGKSFERISLPRRSQ